MEATASRHIEASPDKIAAVMFDPRHDPRWIGGAISSDPPWGDPNAIGARTKRTGGFMGKKFAWATQVVEFEPNRLLRMNFIGGPMNGGDVTYRIEPEGGGSKVSIRNTGPSRAITAWFIKRAVAKDLDRLATIVER
jgi:uncharacterized protein YndB with AHSA1/START domain